MVNNWFINGGSGGMINFFIKVIFWTTSTIAFIMALVPAPVLINVESGDKFLHMIVFFGLTILAGIAYPFYSICRILVSLSILGALIEIFQLIPSLHRDGDVFDWFADVFAVIFGAIILKSYRTFMRVTRRPDENIKVS
jgi:hypothetical protein